MFSSETGSPPPKNFLKRRLVKGMIVLLAGAGFLWLVPFTRLPILLLLAPPQKVSAPILSDPKAITPETVQKMQLLDHWGNGSFNSMAWSPDGHRFVIVTTQGINLYDGETYELLQATYLPLNMPYLPAFSPDGSRIALADGDQYIALFDLQENRITVQWDMAQRVSLLAFLGDGTLLSVTEPGDVMRLVDGGWQHITSLKDGFLTGLAFLPEQQALLAVYADSTQLVDPRTGQSRKLSFVAPYGGNVAMYRNNRVEVDRDLSLVSSYSDDTLVNQVQLTERELFRLLALSLDGSLMATLNTGPSSPWAGTLTLWQLPSLKRIRTLTLPEANLNGNEITFSPDGEKLAILDEPYLVKIIPVQEGSASEISISDPFSGVGDIGISPEGSLWTVHCTGSSVEIRDLRSGEVMDAWEFDEPTCGKLLAGGRSVALSSASGKTHIYQIGEDSTPVSVKAPCCLIFSADGSAGVTSGEAASSGDPLTVGIWQKMFGLYQRWKYWQDGYTAFHIAISPSGQYVAAASREKTHLFLRGVDSGRTYTPLYGKLAFSPDEHSLASAFQILNLGNGTVIELEGSRDLTCTPESFSQPVFSPDGQIMAYAACGELFFWRASDGSLLLRLHDPYFSTELQFSPDGTFLLGEGIGNASVWGAGRKLP